MTMTVTVSAVMLAALALLLAPLPVLGETDGSESPVLACYTCTLSAGTDDSCYTDPDNAGGTSVTECKLGAEQCCIITRIDSTEALGTPLSMYRGCVEDCNKNTIGKMITTSTATTTTYETFCNEPRCNNGPGNVQPGSGGGGGSVISGIQGIGAGTRLQAAPCMLGLISLCLLSCIF